MTIQLKNDTMKVAKEISGQIDEAVDQAGAIGLEAARAQLWPGHGYLTGAMHDSLAFVKEGPGEGSLINPKSYGPEIEMGRAPHMRYGAEAMQKALPDLIKKSVK